MKLIVKVLATVLLLLIAGTNLQAEDVVTIYFGGTGTTKEWWNADDAKAACSTLGIETVVGEFLRPEGVSILHHAQLDSNEPTANAASNHHKFFVDGVCTGCPTNCGLTILSCADASLENGCRGWTTCLKP